MTADPPLLDVRRLNVAFPTPSGVVRAGEALPPSGPSDPSAPAGKP